MLLFLFLLSWAGTPVSAQLQNPKRITALRLGEAAEGSRVTIVADAGLGDYEAFRRGDRFYVKIPLAEFKSSPPPCCASGFEDVQVQRAGDGLVVSFRLQAGASARVDQSSNRMDVIFSSPNRAFRNSTATAAGGNVSRPSQPRTDTAGPMPPGSTQSFRERFVTERTRTDEGRLPPGLRLQTNPSGAGNVDSYRQSQGGINQATNKIPQAPNGANTSVNAQNQTAGSTGVVYPPAVSASPILTPAANYPAITSTSPASSGVSQPASSPTAASNLRNRARAAMSWILTNRLAALVAALILLSLIAYLVILLRRRRVKLIAAKRMVAKVQPKHSSDSELEELPGSDSVTSPAIPNIQKEVVKPTAMASTMAVTPHNQSWIIPKPAMVSSPAGRDRSKDEEEREVFEL